MSANYMYSKFETTNLKVDSLFSKVMRELDQETELQLNSAESEESLAALIRVQGWISGNSS